MSLTRLTPPSAEPVSLAEAKARLRISGDAHDDTINHWIAAARERVERDTGRALLAQTWLERRDRWDGDGRMLAFGTQFRLLKPPLIALEAVTTYDADGTPSDFDPAAFFVDTLAEPGRIALKPDTVWPQPGRRAGGIEIRFRCGYGDQGEDVPPPLREAILQLVVAMAGDGAQAALPPVAGSLISPYRSMKL
jgi:uncharacterized phiE125 gp8 family phage protein